MIRRRSRRRAALAAVILPVAGLAGAARARPAIATAPNATPAVRLAAPRVEPPAPTRDDWYVLELDGRRIGVVHETRGTPGDEAPATAVETRRTTRMRLRRGGTLVRLETVLVFVESEPGRPERIDVHTGDGAGSTTETQWRFLDDAVRETTRQGARETSRTRPRPEGDWLTPVAADAFLRSSVEAGRRTITWRTLDPLAGLDPVAVRLEAGALESIEIAGRPTAVRRWRMTTSAAPGLESSQWRTVDGRLVRERTVLPVGTLEMTASTAEAAAEVPASDAVPELMVASFVQPDRTIDRPRAARRLELRVRRADGGDRPPLAVSAVQSVRPEPAGPGDRAGAVAGAWRVTIDLDAPDAGGGPDPADAGPTPPDRAASPMIDHEDPAIRALRDRALAGLAADAGTAARAEAMRRLVRRHVDPSRLDRLLASASETARSAAGDCTEHAVLLAALLRADAIPARVAAGLVYAESFAGRRDVFGWHLWTQAWVGDRWTDLDATLDVPFDATHLLVDVGPMDGPAGGGVFSRLLALVGGLDVELLDARDAAGRPLLATDGAGP